MTPPKSLSVSGSALFIILIADALFAALSYAVTHSGRGTANMDLEQAELLAARILQYSTAIGSVVLRTRERPTRPRRPFP